MSQLPEKFDDVLQKVLAVEKPVAINRPLNIDFYPSDEDAEPTHLRVAARIKRILSTDCNAGSDIVTPKNFDVLIDPNTKEILISAAGKGKLCLHTVNEAWIRDILHNENENNYSIIINKE